jgi:hypothetical protein
MTAPPLYFRRRALAADHPVELRFVDMLLIIIATLMFVAIVLSVVSAFSGSGRSAVSLEIATAHAPAPIVGQQYELALAARGGDGENTWRLVGGTLPAGLSLRDKDGVIAGVPTAPETTQVSLRVSDGSGLTSATRELGFTVRPAETGGPVKPVPPRIVGPLTLLDDAVAGQEYSHKFAGDAGVPPYRWSGKDLPGGLNLAPDGTLAGRPEAGTSTFTVTMSDGSNATSQQQVRLIVHEEPKSLFANILGWIKTIIMIYGYFLVAMTVLFWLIGTPGAAPRPGILSRLFRK